MATDLDVVCPESANPLEWAASRIDQIMPAPGIPVGPSAVWHSLRDRFGYYVTDQPFSPGRRRVTNRDAEELKGEGFALILLNGWQKQSLVVRAGTDFIYARKGPSSPVRS